MGWSSRIIVVMCGVVVCTMLVNAQQSAHYTIEQGTLNSGGNPLPEVTSVNYQMSAGVIGEGFAAIMLNGPSNEMDVGFVPAYRPPGEVLNLLFSGANTLSWNSEISAGTYNLYRGNVSELSAGYGSKIQSSIASPTTTDGEAPSPGNCFFYLITVSNRLTEEGPKGSGSSGEQRP